MADNNPNDELDFSAQIKSEVDKGNLNVPGLEKEKEDKAQFDAGNESVGQDLAVLISKNIIKCLEAKTQSGDCNLGQLIDIFKISTSNYAGQDGKIQWGFAHVHQYLNKIKKVEAAEMTSLYYSTGPAEVHVELEVDIFKDSPTELEMVAAEKDINKFIIPFTKRKLKQSIKAKKKG